MEVRFSSGCLSFDPWMFLTKAALIFLALCLKCSWTAARTKLHWIFTADVQSKGFCVEFILTSTSLSASQLPQEDFEDLGRISG